MKTALFFLFFLLASVFTDAVLAETDANSTKRYMGVGSCASSNCHGSATPRTASSVIQNEYVTWQRHDAHAKAYLTLLSKDSTTIAHHLGIEKAHESPLCLSCHTTYVPNENLRGEKFHYEDGVGCESCHGASEGWLKAHTEQGATHSRNKELGLKNIVSPAGRAQVCAECHVGSRDANVDHRLIGAGHPRLAFELDTFTELLPRHWEVDEEYEKRKEGYDPAKSWLIGQTVLAASTFRRWRTTHVSWNIFDQDFSMYFCFTCHHSLKEEQWKERSYDGKPGRLRFNLAHLTVLSQAFAVLDLSKHEVISRALHDLNEPGQLSLEAIQRAENFLLTDLLPYLKGQTIDRETSTAILKQLATFGSSDVALPYETAEQIAMAVSALASELNKTNLLQKEIDAIYKSLADPAHFQPRAFQQAMANLLRVL